MFKFIILMIIIININSQGYTPTSTICKLDMEKVMTLRNDLSSSNEQTKAQSMQMLLAELLATTTTSLAECKETTPPTVASKNYTCCAGKLTPSDSLKTMLTNNGDTQSEFLLCLQTEMAYTFQTYFDEIQNQFSNLIKSFTMVGCGKYNSTHMCEFGTNISSMTCAAYPLNPENLTKGYDTCCLMNFDDLDGEANKKCFDAPKKDINYLKQVVKNYKNWGYKGVVVDCFENYIKFGFISLFVLVLVLF